jgi:membrane protease YdiL (CAAX protease family)
MSTSPSKSKSPLIFFLLVFVISIPFWLIGAVTGHLPKAIPINLPISSLSAFCPLIAALILTYREKQYDGIKKLLWKVFDCKRIKMTIWYLPVIFLMPVIMALSYGTMRLMGSPLPEPQIPFLMIPIFLLVFSVGAIGEEVGWSGYVINPMQNRMGALKASIILGSVWAIWHVVPYIQTNNIAAWIAWQCLNTVGLRVLIVWLYNNTGRSVFAAILFHATINVSVFLFPNYGSRYDPAITGVIVASIATIVIFLWGSATLARYRYARLV